MHKVWFDEAWEDCVFWLSQDKKTIKRINALIKDIERNRFEGMGKPEPLKGDLAGFRSRRIDETNRIVYRFCGEVLEIIPAGVTIQIDALNSIPFPHLYGQHQADQHEGHVVRNKPKQISFKRFFYFCKCIFMGEAFFVMASPYHILRWNGRIPRSGDAVNVTALKIFICG